MPITNEAQYKAACARRAKLIKKSDDAHKYAERLESEARAQRDYGQSLDADIIELDHEAEEYYSGLAPHEQQAICDEFRASLRKSDGESRLRLMEGGL